MKIAIHAANFVHNTIREKNAAICPGVAIFLIALIEAPEMQTADFLQENDFRIQATESKQSHGAAFRLRKNRITCGYAHVAKSG